MRSSEVWFRDLAVAHRERVSHNRSSFWEEGLVQNSIVLFPAAGNRFTQARFGGPRRARLLSPGLADPRGPTGCSFYAMTNDIRYSVHLRLVSGDQPRLASWSIGCAQNGLCSHLELLALSPGASDRELGFPLLGALAEKHPLVHHHLSRGWL